MKEKEVPEVTEVPEVPEVTEVPELITLSLAACQVLRPVYSNALNDERDAFANKILQRMK